MKYNKIITILSILTIVSCTASHHNNNLQSSHDRKMTVGTVQKYIQAGMTTSEVASLIGSPNIVTSINSNAETWIYDKIASEISYSQSSTGADLLILRPLRSALLGGGVGFDFKSGASSQNQRTLTVIINFINNQVVDFKYHSSSF